MSRIIKPKAGYFDPYRSLKRSSNIILHDPISAAASALNMVINAVAGPKIGPFIGQGLIPGFANLLSTSDGKSASLKKNPHLINTRDTDEIVPPVYGKFRKGGNWVFAEESGGSNKYLNIVITWAEGLCNGIAYTTEYKPAFKGAGLNDMQIKGVYSGASNKKFRVQIDGTGIPDTFKWSPDDGATWTATTVAITGDWQALSDDLLVKFSATTGHTSGNRWTWMAGLGIWIGQSLLGFFEDFDPGSLDLADHYFHNGSITQTVDANLQAECPLYADVNRRTCYSYLRLKFNTAAYPNGVGDIFALGQWRHLFDPREVSHDITDETTWAYSNNAALVALDWVYQRFGMHRAYARIDEDSLIDVANWCDTNTMTFNGAILAEQPPEDTLRDIEMCYRGFHFERDGKLVFGVFADDAAVMTFAEDEIAIDPDSFVINIPGIPETPDRVVAWYQEPYLDYAAKQVYYPDDAGLANESALNEMEIDLIGITDRQKAKQLAKYHYLRAVYNKTYQIILPPRSYALEPGDMIALTHTFPGWSSTKVRVLSFGIAQDKGWFQFTVIEENSAIYNTTVNMVTDDITNIPGIYTYPPDLSAGSVSAKGDGFKIIYTQIANIDISQYVIYVSESNDPDTSVVIKRISGKHSSDSVDLGVVSETGGITLTAGTTYYFWITALDENGHESLTKFALGSASSAAGGPEVDADAPTTPTNLTLTVTPYGGKKLKAKWACTWTAGVDAAGHLAGNVIEIVDNDASETIETKVVKKADAVSCKGKGLRTLDDNGVAITYKARIRAYDRFENYSAWSSYTDNTSGADTTAPSAPTGGSVIAKAGAFKTKWNKVTAPDLEDYIIYANTANNSAKAAVISRPGRANKKTIHLGEQTETGIPVIKDTFETASGSDETWTQNTVNGATLNFDASIPAGVSGWGSECLGVYVTEGSGEKSIQIQVSPLLTDYITTFEFVLASSSLAAGQYAVIHSDEFVSVRIYNVAGVLKFNFYYGNNYYSNEIVLGQKYNFEIEMHDGGISYFNLDGVQIGAPDFHEGESEYFSWGFNSTANVTGYFDNIEVVDLDTYVNDTMILVAGTTYYFWVSAVDTSGNESSKCYLGATACKKAVQVATGGIGIEDEDGALINTLISQGTAGGFIRETSEAVATLSGASTVIQVNVPSGSRLLGVQLRVDTTITSGDGATSWAAAYSGGSSTVLATGQAFTQNTKVSKLHIDEVASVETDITITPNSGTFSGGIIRAIVYYEYLSTMGDMNDVSPNATSHAQSINLPVVSIKALANSASHSQTADEPTIS